MAPSPSCGGTYEQGRWKVPVQGVWLAPFLDAREVGPPSLSTMLGMLPVSRTSMPSCSHVSIPRETCFKVVFVFEGWITSSSFSLPVRLALTMSWRGQGRWICHFGFACALRDESLLLMRSEMSPKLSSMTKGPRDLRSWFATRRQPFLLRVVSDFIDAPGEGRDLRKMK